MRLLIACVAITNRGLPRGGDSFGARANTHFARSLFSINTAEERIEALGIASTYLVGMNESGNQKGNLSYLAGTKKRSDSLIQLIFHRRGARADEANEARALFFSNTAEERVGARWQGHCATRNDSAS